MRPNESDRIVDLPVEDHARADWGWSGDDGFRRSFKTVLVSAVGQVFAYDRVAEHFTVCHDLSEDEQQRARILAR